MNDCYECRYFWSEPVMQWIDSTMSPNMKIFQESWQAQVNKLMVVGKIPTELLIPGNP